MFLWVLQAHQSQNLTFSSFNPCPSLSSIATDDRKQFQCLDTVLNKKKLDYYFRNSVAKTRCSFSQDSKLLVCTWRHDGHVGGPKHFSPLETKPYFHVNSWRKKKIILYGPPTWPPCHVVASQESAWHGSLTFTAGACYSYNYTDNRCQEPAVR